MIRLQPVWNKQVQPRSGKELIRMKKPFLCCLLTLLLLVSFAHAEDTTLYVFGSSGAGDS